MEFEPSQEIVPEEVETVIREVGLLTLVQLSVLPAGVLYHPGRAFLSHRFERHLTRFTKDVLEFQGFVDAACLRSNKSNFQSWKRLPPDFEVEGNLATATSGMVGQQTTRLREISAFAVLRRQCSVPPLTGERKTHCKVLPLCGGKRTSYDLVSL